MVLLFVSSLWVLAYSVEERLARDMSELLEAQQFTTVSYVASDLDVKLRQRMQLLEDVATIVTPELLADPKRARAFLGERFGLLSMFRAGISLVSKDGEGITDYPAAPERGHADFSQIEYYREVVSTGRPAIGKPRIGRFTKKPGVAIAAPVRDRSGRLIGLLAVWWLYYAAIPSDPSTHQLVALGMFGAFTLTLLIPWKRNG